jgi:hypothetical protein
MLPRTRAAFSVPALVLFGAFVVTNGCHSNAAPESAPIGPSPGPTTEPADLPKETPRFAWRGPLSVHVDEQVEKQETALRLTYTLDVCPGDDGMTLVTHRNVRVSEVGGVSVGANPPADIRAIEAASSALPTMVIDAHGQFKRGTGYSDTLKRLVESYPGEDFSVMRQAGGTRKAAAILDATLSTLWQGWVSAWLLFDPSRGASQDHSAATATTGGTGSTVVFDGFTADHHAKLHSRYVLSRAEMDQLAKAFAKDGIAPDAFQAVEIQGGIETDWPEIRPYHTRTERRILLRDQGRDFRASEVHDYTFTWPPAGTEAPTCP